MVIVLGVGQFLDFFPLIFVATGLIGCILGIVALIVGRKAKNAFRGAVVGLFIFAALLFIGAFVNGIIGATHPSVSYSSRYDYYLDQYQCEINYADPHACSWVCLGLGSGAALFGLISFIVQLATKNIVVKEKEKKVVGTKIEEDTSDILLYEEYSYGAIEIRQDYLVLYRNWLPFTKFKAGRTSMIIFINDIQHIEYKGCGWFNGFFGLTFRHYNRPVIAVFGKWFFWRRMKFNKRMTPVYEYLRSRVIENNKERTLP